MIKNIIIGNYIPVVSIIHKLDPRTKLFISMIFMISLFVASKYLLALSIISVLLLVSISGISIKKFFKSAKGVSFFIIFSSVLNIFYSQGEVVFRYYFITITKLGIENCIFYALRMLNLIFMSSIISFTTLPSDMVYGIEYFLQFLKIFKINTQDISLIISISLRFIPVIFEETNKIIIAQKSRGANFEEKNIIKRTKTYLNILFPMFYSCFKRASDLAVALESRCYNNSIKHTKLKKFKLKKIDYLFIFLFILHLILIIIISKIFLK
ncbi:MAG: energy-coupling factor transporter transmembrane protein EcfT [Candidatus Paraimprobicoccus trichonymphae]|uniref:Energy-coupling factor transporter transmembrane protein EcfT n=1 Tax=Candidatus Paraimprobicoccus trichonymphae TaxID=3033793 RepID=A0AA48HWA6_9FIRM|nr:MAG: energy-coupling factor transporter transmembrane protein EcfT [Candidatus Paraimprobicoccus trichonymphae]